MPSPTAPLNRRERERLARRRAMLDAARSVFAEKGYEHARLDEIAERAEFGKGTLYNYFEGGKEDILFALFEDSHAALAQRIATFFADPSLAQRSARDVFRGLLNVLLDYFRGEREVLALLLKESQRLMLHDDVAATRRMLALRERMVEPLVAPMEAARAAGIVRDVSPRLAAHFIVGSMLGHLLYAVTCERAFGSADPSACPVVGAEDLRYLRPESSTDMLATLLLDGLLARPDALFTLSS
ncbi:MAG: TetR/AcrR family transcriptional regulator [Rhodothermales bacterium]|nr:TetR/AcrR family transcriptional regulator [Rhodothermales bacterium]MCA0267679.1 TetR/AcrR family transcriptional regulator [Bacteroidota bacterium]